MANDQKYYRYDENAPDIIEVDLGDNDVLHIYNDQRALAAFMGGDVMNNDAKVKAMVFTYSSKVFQDMYPGIFTQAGKHDYDDREYKTARSLPADVVIAALKKDLHKYGEEFVLDRIYTAGAASLLPDIIVDVPYGPPEFMQAEDYDNER